MRKRVHGFGFTIHGCNSRVRGSGVKKRAKENGQLVLVVEVSGV
jgi:hypothetical protein